MHFRVLLTLMMLFGAQGATAGERVALMIGNDNYAGFRALSQAVGDARRVGDVLESLPQPFTVTRANNVNKLALNRALSNFQSQLKRSSGDVALVYYAGHAVSYQNQVWLLPVDAKIEVPSDIEVVAMSLEQVAAKLRVGGWKAVVLVLDACRNSLFADGQAPKGLRGDALPRGLGRIPQVEGLLLAYATASGQVAAEDPSSGGYYTRELLDQLRQPGLKLQDVFINTALAVERNTGQKPELTVTAIEPIYLAGMGSANPGTSASTDPERQFWEESRCNSGDRSGCEAYLSAYPAGRFVVLAKARLATHLTKSPESPKRENNVLMPEMVSIPGGTFEMGSPTYEPGRHDSEGPLTRIAVKPFRMGKYEVTIGEFRSFVAATGYRTDAEKDVDMPDTQGGPAKGRNSGCYVYKGGGDFGWTSGSSWRDVGFAQGEDHPVACVSWRDARAYIEWLNRETRRRYRLPSEAEQEFSIRAGSGTPYPWGADPNQACTYANAADQSIKGILPSLPSVSCNDGSVFTSAVGRYAANSFGLYDTVGNASEWSQDCFHTYTSRGRKEITTITRVSDGKVIYDGERENKDPPEVASCAVRVLRGAAWYFAPDDLRSADRVGSTPVGRDSSTGFRLAEDL